MRDDYIKKPGEEEKTPLGDIKKKDIFKKNHSEDRKVPINKLKKFALEMSDKMTSEDELRAINVTAIVQDEWPKMLANGELINAQFNGEPGSGKSLAMIAMLKFTNDILGKQTTIHHIFNNQITYADEMKKMAEREYHVAIGIDEYDTMGETGYNATTEAAFLESFSDLHRARYIHKLACAPKDIIDKNVNIIFDMPAPDKRNKFTRFLVYYRLFKGGRDIDQLIGYCDINVAPVLESQLYKDYTHRKMERLTLFNKYGIITERPIHWAEVILHAYNKLRPMAKYQKIDRDLCELQIDSSARQLRQLNSMLHTDKQTKDLFSLLKYAHYQQQTEQKLSKLQKIRNDGQDTNGKFAALIKEHLTILANFQEQERERLNELKELTELKPLFSSKLHEVLDNEPVRTEESDRKPRRRRTLQNRRTRP